MKTFKEFFCLLPSSRPLEYQMHLLVAVVNVLSKPSWFLKLYRDDQNIPN